MPEAARVARDRILSPPDCRHSSAAAFEWGGVLRPPNGPERPTAVGDDRVTGVQKADVPRATAKPGGFADKPASRRAQPGISGANVVNCVPCMVSAEYWRFTVTLIQLNERTDE